MFKILGADGKEYGPVTIDQIKKWIIEGRANRETMAQQTGDSNWKTLGEFADFGDALGIPPPVQGAVQPPVATPARIAPAAAAPAPAFRSSADPRARAEQLVAGPAICLMVTAGLGLLFGLIGLTSSLFFPGQVPSMPGLDPDVVHFIEKFAYGPIAIGTKIIGIAISALILVGGIRMQKLTSHGLSLAVAIIAMIPCLSPCCLLGIPFGIWALIVLSKPEVKSQFN